MAIRAALSALVRRAQTPAGLCSRSRRGRWCACAIPETLGELGYAAVETADGPPGLRMPRSNQRIDLLVTDVGPPGPDGRQLADAARVARPGLKVLFITGHAHNAAMGNDP